MKRALVYFLCAVLAFLALSASVLLIIDISKNISGRGADSPAASQDILSGVIGLIWAVAIPAAAQVFQTGVTTVGFS